jgi:beta-galactosidase
MESNGYVDGELVCTHKVQPSIRPVKIKLWIDDEDLQMEANGNDLVVLHAMVTDENGRVKRLNNQILTFELDGEGELVFPDGKLDNSIKVEYGVASVLVRSTVNPGDIKVRVRPKYQGIHTPEEGNISIKTHPAEVEMLYDEKILLEKTQTETNTLNQSQQNKNRKAIEEELKLIEKQQDAFGEKKR